MRAGALGGLACMLLLVVHGLVLAQSDEATRRAARDLGNEGIALYENGDYPASQDKLERAYQVMKVPTLGLWSARALAKNGKLVAASERYLEVSRMELTGDSAEVMKEAIADAGKEYDALQPRIPSLTILLSEGETTSGTGIEMDGTKLRAALIGVPIAVDPGDHRFIVSRQGKTLTGNVTVVESEKKQIRLTFKQAGNAPAAEPASRAVLAPYPTPTDPPPVADSGADKSRGSGHRVLGFVALGVGGLGLAGSAVAGGLAMQRERELKDDGCSDGRCPTGLEDDIRQYNLLRMSSTAGFVIGAVGAAAGLALILTAPRRPSAAAGVEAYVSPDCVGVRGRF